MKCKYNKIRIIGASGSGKTYLGKKLENYTKIKFTSIDSLAYDLKETHKFEKRRTDKETRKLLNELIKKKSWILDGGYYQLTKDTYNKADIIIFLKPNFNRRILNTLKRFFIRIKEGKYEGLFNFLSLTHSNIKIRKKWDKERPELFKKEFGEKLHIFNSAEEAFEWFKKNC